MKIMLIIMVKNGEDSIISTIRSYEKQVDIIKIYDTGSTDNTIELIKGYKKTIKTLKVYLNFIPFEDFSQARNLCLDLAHDTNYQWTIFADDSYELVGDLKKELSRLDRKINCVAIRIHRNIPDQNGNSNIVDYVSKRITRTSAKLVYKGNVHEDIQSDIHYIIKDSYMNDVVYNSHVVRTSNRLLTDIKMIKGLKDSRSLLIRANMTFQLFHRGLCHGNAVINACYQKLELKVAVDKEESYSMLMTAGLMCYLLGYHKETLKNYLVASLCCPEKSGEPFYYIYLNTGSLFYLKKAHQNRFLGFHVLPSTSSVYSTKTHTGLIEQCYNKVMNSALQ